MDSTYIVDLPGGKLIGHPNNYWMVMARLEKVRAGLGIETDPRIFELAVRRTGETLCRPGAPYLDDDEQGAGRYDVYTFDALLNAEPLWPLLGQEGVREALAAHEKLLLAVANPSGHTVTWGRSAENSNVDGADLAAALVACDAASDAPRLLGLLARFRDDWWADDAVTAHRHKMTHWYRGPSRLVEYSACALSVVAQTARHLRDIAQREPAAPVETNRAKLFPPQDQLVAFDDRGLGVWCYRDASLDFQLPVVAGFTSDYVAAPRCPGVFEQPVDRELACGVPNAFFGKKRYLPLRTPIDVRHEAGKLSWTTPAFTHYNDFDWWKGSDDQPGRREVTCRVEGEALVFDERWTFEQMPDALAIQFAEALVELDIQLEASVPLRRLSVVTDGMPDWRSYWNPLRRVHQFDFDPAREVRLTYRVRPVR